MVSNMHDYYDDFVTKIDYIGDEELRLSGEIWINGYTVILFIQCKNSWLWGTQYSCIASTLIDIVNYSGEGESISPSGAARISLKNLANAMLKDGLFDQYTFMR